MRIVRSMAAVAVAMLLIAGCEGSVSPVAPDPNLALTGPFPVTLPALGDNKADEEEFESIGLEGPTIG